MKNIYRILPLLPILALLWSCNEATKPYLEVRETIKPKYEKTILLEDYTGIKCGNCPAAHETANSIKLQYPNNVIILEVHAGSFALPTPKHPQKFAIPEGEEWYKFFGINKNPIGMVNRNSTQGVYMVNPDKWKQDIETILADTTPPLATISMSVQYNESSGEVTATINYEISKNIDSLPNLTVCLVEDSIVYYQIDYRQTPQDIEDYVHNNVMRATFKGTTWGEPLPNKKDTKVITYTIDLKNGWRPQKMRVIAFLHDVAGKTNKVYQSAEAPLY